MHLTRADEWWVYKLVPILSAFYATALVLRVAVSALWTGALTLFLAIVTAAIYATAINELTDRGDDAAAGKRNRAADAPRTVAALMAASAGAGFAVAWLWRDDVRLVCCYAAILVAFALYSVRPIRLKARGLAGVLCDAAGEQMLPALTAVLVASRGAHHAASTAWLASVAVWSLAFGVRGILWHQFRDVENDRAAGVRTFVSSHPNAASQAGASIVFPLELAAFAAMLWQIGGAWSAAFLALYALYAIRVARAGVKVPVIVAPKPRSFIVMQDFYTDLFPLALLIAASIRHRGDLAILAAHLLLHPGAVIQPIRRLSASMANTVVKASEPHHGGFG